MKSIRPFALCLALLPLLGGCGGNAGGSSATTPDSSIASDSATVSSSAAARTVTDVWGRTVELPETVDGIVCLGSGAPRMAAYLDVMDLLVGAEEHDQEYTVLRDYNPVWQETLSALPVVGAGGGSGANNGYPEEIITAAPDVILAGFTAEAADELQSQTGIPVVCVRYQSINFVDQTFYDAMEVFAQVVGAEERCQEVLSYIDSCKEDLAARSESLQSPRVYTGAVTFSGRHGFAGTYANFGPFLAVGANNVADELAGQNYFEVDLEKVVTWDPEIIFLDPGNMDLVQDEYRQNPGYFQSLGAVQAGQLYAMPSFNNCGTNITYALMDAYYAGTVLYPEAFSDIEMAEKGGEILTALLGEDTFEQMKEGGLVYGPLTLE